ncbi:hypothetical protein CLOM_g5723 [Closterium sp. NIES-68]|nr:hypothetical protein CLOM_g5723 [Closterium sp. NIES-68]
MMNHNRECSAALYVVGNTRGSLAVVILSLQARLSTFAPTDSTDGTDSTDSTDSTEHRLGQPHRHYPHPHPPHHFLITGPRQTTVAVLVAVVAFSAWSFFCRFDLRYPDRSEQKRRRGHSKPGDVSKTAKHLTLSLPFPLASQRSKAAKHLTLSLPFPLASQRSKAAKHLTLSLPFPLASQRSKAGDRGKRHDVSMVAARCGMVPGGTCSSQHTHSPIRSSHCNPPTPTLQDCQPNTNNPADTRTFTPAPSFRVYFFSLA